MKFKQQIAIIGLLLILLLMNGCDSLLGENELSVQDQASTSVAETLAAMHAVETIIASTLAAGITDTATPEPTATVEPTSTDIPVDAPTDPLPDQPTATLSVPMVSVSVNTNCRTGPGTVYDRISALLIGQEAEVVARTADGTYWVIRNPAGSGTCWLWGFYATVTGPTAGLPVWDPPPTPTPVATITLTPTATSTNTPAPTTYKTGPLEIEQTYLADLDEGVIITTGTADLWFQAETATAKYLNPRNGARIAIWGTSAPGMYDCIGAPLSTSRIPISSAPVGTYVCYQTNQGRPGAFRVNELTGGPPVILKIGFTTWNAP
jgi:hypothetical protein